METWKPIPISPDYEISSEGRIRRLTDSQPRRSGFFHPRGTPRKTWHNNRGYEYVSLRVNGKTKGFQVHRLVMLSFVGPCDLQVNHKNGLRGDNRLENLEYVTPRENQQHSKNVLGTFNMGSRHHQAKLTEDDVREILRMGKSGKTTLEIATLFPVSATMIGYILQRKWWKHVEVDESTPTAA